MVPDLTGIRGQAGALALLGDCITRARADGSRHAFVSLPVEAATEVARTVDKLCAAGRSAPPLAGMAVSIKDLFDVRGAVTTAGSRVLEARAPAETDAPAAARRRSLRRPNQHVGVRVLRRRHQPALRHAGQPYDRFDRSRAAHPGRVDVGGAVSVATGAAWAALGSDAAGSIRIPAALHGLVGFKNTARLTPTEGAIPLSTTLDTVCAITRSIRDAALMHEPLADRVVPRTGKPLDAMRLAVPTMLMLDSLDATVGRVFERSLAALRATGVRLDEIALPPLAAVPASLSPPEAWAWHRRLLAEHEHRYDPRVVARIRRGAALSAADYIDLRQERRAWIACMRVAMSRFDAMLSPTVPLVAPPLAPLLASDDAFFTINALLLRNPGVVNMLDGCALTLPCHHPGEMPVGLMVWSGALPGDAVLEVSLAIKAALAAASR